MTERRWRDTPWPYTAGAVAGILCAAALAAGCMVALRRYESSSANICFDTAAVLAGAGVLSGVLACGKFVQEFRRDRRVHPGNIQLAAPQQPGIA